MWRGVVVSGCLLAGCVVGPSELPGAMEVDPVAGPPCPAEHLAVAARSLDYETAPAVLRFDRELRSCRGLVLGTVDEPLWTVGGMPDGSDLLGFDGRLMRVRDIEPLWSVEGEGPVLDVVHATIAGTSHVVVLWGSSTSSRWADRLALHDPESGDVRKTYDVSSEVRAVTAYGEDRLLLVDQYDGFTEVVVDPSAEALGGVDGLDVRAPRVSAEITHATFEDGRVAVASGAGILHWTPDTPAMLGPASCRWSRWTGDPLPEECDYTGVAFDPAGDGWLTICDALLRLDPRDGCEPLIAAERLPNRELTDLAWSGS